MLRTIEIGTGIWVQGHFAGRLSDGRIKVRVYSKVYVGRPVQRTVPEPA